MKKILLLMGAVSLLSSCMQYPATQTELRKEVNEGGFMSGKEAIIVKAPFKTVVNRLVKKTNDCLSYQITTTGGGKTQFTYTPKLIKPAKGKVTIVINTRFRTSGFLVAEDTKGVSFLVDIEYLSKRKTKVTTYQYANNAEFEEAILTAAKGEKGVCPRDL